MAGKAMDRKGKVKDTKSVVNEHVDTLAAFTLPDSLPCSEIEFPVIPRRTPKANWQEILKESDEEYQEVLDYIQSKEKPTFKSPFLKTECDYIKNEVFVHLIPALEETLYKAKLWEALNIQKCFFNGLDHIAQVENVEIETALPAIDSTSVTKPTPEYCPPPHTLLLLPTPTAAIDNTRTLSYPDFSFTFWSPPKRLNMVAVMTNLKLAWQVLWNNNPRYPGRKEIKMHLFNMPWVREYLKTNPRPYYPKSWLWPEDYAATLIQKTVRQYFVQREDEVQEMREFWRKLKFEKNVPDMEMNPFLARKFASNQSMRKN